MGNRELWTLRKLRINLGGYTPEGHYYGYDRQLPVYEAIRESDGYTLAFRNQTRAGAKAYVRQRHPYAMFYN
jgi:hypothetical protein